MSEENKTEQQEQTQEQQEQQELSNNDVKSHPLFQKLTEQLSEFQRKEQERAAAEEKAAREAELKKAEEEGKWQDIVKMREQEIENLRASYAKDMLERDLKTELVRAGFSNDVFLKGAIGSYSGDPEGVTEYVEQLKADAGNAVFLNQAQQAANSTPAPPSTPTITGTKLSDAKIVAMEKSSDPAERAQARAHIEALLRSGQPLPKK